MVRVGGERTTGLTWRMIIKSGAFGERATRSLLPEILFFISWKLLSFILRDLVFSS
jgi:hypothetical protein